MAEIDSLEIKIKSEATTALQSLNKLISKIDTLSGALNKINVGNISSQMSKLTSAFKDINIKGFSEINQSVRETGKSMKKLSDEAKKVSKVKFTFDTSDYEKTIKKLQSKFSEVGKGFKVNGNLDQLQKQFNKLSTDLDKLFSKQEKIISVGKMSPENATFQNLQYDIAEATNKLAKFQNAISKFKMPEKGSFEQRNPKFSLPETSINTKPLEYFRNSLEDINSMMQKVVTQSNIDNFVSSLETDLGRLKKAFPEQIQLIEDYKNKIESLRNPEINTDKAFKGISDAAKYSTEQSQKSLKEALEENAQKAKTLRERLKQLQVPPIKEENLEKLSNMLSKAKEKMATLKAELANKLLMGEVTESEDDKKYVKMRKEIALTGKTIDALQNKIKSIKSIKIAGFEEAAQKTKSLGNKVDVLKAKLEQLKSQGLNFGDKEFDKAYSKLNKAEAELKEYKTNLEGAGNASSRFASTSIPNFKKVTNVIGKMGSGISSAAKKIVNLSVPFNSVSASSDGLAKKLGKLFIVFQSFRGLGDIIGKSIDLSSDLTEQQNVIDVSFGKYKKSIEDLAKVSVPQFGMSELTAKTIAGRFQSMGVAIGYSQKQMSGMSVELTKLAADMASFYNVEQADVAKSLESVFTGTTEPMRRYGIDLTQATLEEWAYKQGIDAKMKSMSQAEKTMLRYQYVLANTSAAQGDFARTSGSWANQTRVLMQSFQQLGTIVGGVLINALKPLVKGLNVVMQQVISFAKVISDALGHIFGWTYEEGGGITDDFAGGVDGAGDLADGMGDVADATDDATKKQKEFNKQLAKFDELNNYTTSKGGKDKDKDDGGGTSLDDLAGLGGAAAGKWVETDSILKKFKSEIDTLEELGEYIATSLTKAMEGIDWDGIYKKAENFGSGLASFLNGLFTGEKGKKLFEATGKTIAGTLNTMLHSALAFAKKFKWKDFGKNLASGLKSFFKTFDWDLGVKTFNTLANGILDSVIGALDEISISDLKKVAEKIAELIGKADVSGISFKVGKIANKLVQDFYTLVSNKDTWKNLGKQIANGINNFFKGMGQVDPETGLNGWEALGKSISGSIDGILTTIITALDGIHWVEIGQAIADFIKNMDTKQIGWDLGKLGNSLANAFYTLVSKKETWKLLGQKISDGINGFFEGMNEVDPKTGLTGWTALGKSISDTILGFGDMIITALDGVHWEEVGQAIADLIAGIDWGAVIWKLGEVVKSFAEALKKTLTGAGVPEPLSNLVVNVGIGGWIIKKLSKTKLIGGILSKIGDKFSVPFGRVRAVIKEWLANKKDMAVSGLKSKISKAIGKITTTFKDVGAKVKNWIANSVSKTGLKAKIVEKVGKIATVFKDVGAVIKGWLPTLGKGGKISDLISGIKTALGITKSGFSLGSIKTALSLKLPKIPTFVFPDPGTDDLVRQFDQWLYHALGDKDFVEFTVDIFVKIGEFIGDIASEIGNFFSGTWEDTTALTSGIDVGNDLANGILQGFANALVYPANFLYNLIVKPVKEALGIHSPSTVFEKIAEYCVSGFLNGFNLKEKIEELLEKIGLPNVFEIALDVKGSLDEKAKNIKDWFAEKGKQTKDFIINAKGKTEDTFNKVRNAWNSFKEGTKNVAVRAKGKVEDTFNKVRNAWNSFKESTKSLWVKARGKVEQAFENVSNTWENFKDGVKTVWAKAKGETENTFDIISEKWESFKEGTKELWIKAKGEAEDSFQKVFDAWTDVKDNAKDKIVELAVSLSAKKEDIENSIGTIKDKLKDKVVNLGVDLKTKVDDLWNNFRKDYPKLWEKVVTFGAEIKQKASDIWSSFKKENPELWDKVISFKSTISTKTSEIWSSISGKWKDFTKDKKLNIKLAFDFAVSAMKSAINTIIGWINSYIINNLNKISIKIPEIKIAGKTLFGGKTFGFDIANIKTLEKGTKGLSKDELGIVNDQKGNTYKELIIPPHGTPFIPDGRNVMLAMQKGTKVIPAGKTKRFIANLPHFANGTEVNISSDGSKNTNKTGLGIATGVSQAINDTLIPYIREMIRILQDNASNGSSASKKKTTTKYADTVKEIQAAWTGLAKWFESTVVEPITKGFNTMKEELAKVFDNTNEELTQKYTEISTEWQGVLTEIPGWLKENVNDAITSNFTDFCSKIAEGIKTTWGNIQNVLSPVPEWIENDITNPVKGSFTGIFTDIETEHGTMWDIMSTYASGKVDWITAITEAAFTRFSYLISEFENKLDALDRDISATESAISDTANKINETKRQLEEMQALSNDLGVNTGSTKQNNTFASKIQDASITEAFAEIPKKTSQFVQASAENTISRLEGTLKKRARFGRYAAGGFPEDGWFRASHGEIMGQFDNGQSVVANNQQITSGIANAVYPAVYNAMMAAMASSGGNGGDIVVQIDGENVFRVVRDKDNDFYKRNHKGAFEH